MKKLQLLFCTFAIFSFGSAQNYVPFPTGDAVWSVGIMKYFTKGTVTIDTLKYQRIFSTPKNIYTTSDDTLVGAYTTYHGLLRNDSLNRKVYGIGSNVIYEKLMYDFSKNVTDTVDSYCMVSWWTPAHNKLVVQSVDSILVMGKYRKRMFMRPIGTYARTEYWIEGIGSSNGPIGNGFSASHVTDFDFDPLLCLHVNGQLRYQEAGFNTCYYKGVGASEFFREKLKLRIYPNPVSQKLKIEIASQEDPQVFELELYDGEGAQVWHAMNANLMLCEIDMSSFSEGIYFLRIINQSGYSDFRKIIKD